MIKIGITGAETAMAGELIRILINHPESDIITLFSPRLNGRGVPSVHHGLIGENIVNFSDRIDPSELDIIYLLDNSEISEQIKTNRNKWPELRLIDLSSQRPLQGEEDFETGLSETNRKGLVRGAKYSTILTSPASAALISLAPLAQFLLLNPEIKIDLLISKNETEVFAKKSEIEQEIGKRLNEIQTSFPGNIEINITPLEGDSRIQKETILLDSLLSLDEISKIYNEIYDDHNFTFVTHSPVAPEEVEGTQKVIISLSKPTSDKLEIQVISDAKMRGGAGDAIHVMNLLFGLYEKTGLQLKASSFGLKGEPDSASSSWFA